jgi:N-sulfoglucosamine sulfohydrolase
MQQPSPAEELYDLQSDPQELKNLAGEPKRLGDLKSLRAGLDAWIAQAGDLSAQSEAEMVERMWPGGQQPETLSVTACRNADGETELSSATDGASIGFRLDGDVADRFRLYSAPIITVSGFSAKAIRYGYKPSVTVRFSANGLQVCGVAPH